MRTALYVLIAAVVAGSLGFVAGFRAATSPVNPPAARSGAGAGAPAAAVSHPDDFARLAAASAWDELVERLDGPSHGTAQTAAAERLRLLDLAGELASRGRGHDALQLMSSYVSHNPRDARAQFLLSDLIARHGDPRDALGPLFAVLDFPPDEESAERARRRADRLIDGLVERMAGVADVVGLIDLHRDLVLREPGYDRHRLGLVRWLVRGDRLDEAAAELAEVGNVGVSSDELDAVREELVLARSELPLIRQGPLLFADLYVAGVPVRMLVDTGASQTGFRPEVLRRVGSTDLGRAVQVRTAGGTVSARLFRVRELALGELTVAQLDVLALDSLPAGVEGLLGMDVLDGYPRLDL